MLRSLRRHAPAIAFAWWFAAVAQPTGRSMSLSDPPANLKQFGPFDEESVCNARADGVRKIRGVAASVCWKGDAVIIKPLEPSQ